MIKIQGVPYWRLSGYYFLFFITVGVYIPYWPLYLNLIGCTAEQIGILSAIVVGVKVFATYLWGWVVDRTGTRTLTIRVTSLLSVCTFIAALFVKDFWNLAFVMFLFSVFWSAALPQIDAATLSYLGRASHHYTIIRVWGSVGFIIAVYGLGFAFQLISIGQVPVILLVSIILVWLLTLSLPMEKNAPSGPAATSLSEVLRKPSVIALFCACFLMLVSHGPYYTFYSIYLKQHGYSSVVIGQMWALGVVAEVILFIVMHRLIKILGLRPLLLLSFSLACLRWLLIGFFVDHFLLLCLAQVLHAATFGICHAVAIQYVHKYFTGALQGRGQGLYSSASFGGGFAVGSLLSGYAWENLGAAACFVAASVLACIGFIIAWIWLRD